MGKVTSLVSVAQTTNAHIIGLAETKLGKTHPKVQGYEWKHKPRTTKSGGGVAILIREDIYHMTEEVKDLEDQDQEIIWIKIDNGRTKIFVGVYYGPQEKCSNEEAERQYAQLTAQINKLKTRGQVILMGDFNAKIEINNAKIQQEQTRNGKHLEKMMCDTDTTPISYLENQQAWTRTRKRKDMMEKSVIDYVIMTKTIAETTNLVYVDEAGTHKLKGKEETDHNTIIIETKYPTTTRAEKRKLMNLKDSEGWEKFNKLMEEEYEHNMPESYSQYEKAIKKAMDKSFKTITVKKGEYKYKKNRTGEDTKKRQKSS